jgi:hypothetical protein
MLTQIGIALVADVPDGPKWVAAMGPMLQTYRMSPSEYWELSVIEWQSLYWWLQQTEVVAGGE